MFIFTSIKDVESGIISFKQAVVNAYQEGLNAYVQIPSVDGGAIINVSETCGIEIYGINDLIALKG